MPRWEISGHVSLAAPPRCSVKFGQGAFALWASLKVVGWYSLGLYKHVAQKLAGFVGLP